MIADGQCACSRLADRLEAYESSAHFDDAD
jgi:hypothetical protein